MLSMLRPRYSVSSLLIIPGRSSKRLSTREFWTLRSAKVYQRHMAIETCTLSGRITYAIYKHGNLISAHSVSSRGK